MTDLAALLYLNPELGAGGATTITQAAALLGSDARVGTLPNVVPTPPDGFDPRVYLAAQPGVSQLNAAIRQAMLATGLGTQAIWRRGIYVATLVQDVILISVSDMHFRVPTPSGVGVLQFTPDRLAVGDHVRMQRSGTGEPLDGVVSEVDEDAFGFSLDPATTAKSNRGPVLVGAEGGTLHFVALGIRIWDAERQALVAYARESLVAAAPAEVITYPLAAPVGSNTPLADSVPVKSFDARFYRNIYPDSAKLPFADTYIDYRTRWTRSNEFRLARGQDIANLSSPLYGGLSNGGGGGSGGGSGGSGSTGGDLIINGILYSGCLTATPTYVAINGALRMNALNVLGNGDIVLGGSRSNLFIPGSSSPSSNLLSINKNAVVVSDSGSNSSVRVAGRLGIGMDCLGHEGVAALDPLSQWEEDQDMTNVFTRLAVDGNIYATGTVISLSDPRTKTDIRPIESALAKVAKLRGVTYRSLNATNDSKRRHVGLLASDVLEALPEAVYKQGEYHSVAYGNVVALLVEAIHELTAFIGADRFCQQVSSKSASES